ncbi:MULTISPECIES: DNA-3-methyladenine glycosylase 2 [unclassified Achromobacter]|uniref:DNA-3-methyladenine glycosylase 2 n=1 Tax=unclassified Achromobacter TaxID=2626865 RepID=UPI001E3C172D|nr:MULTISPECIES: DNA-3-methyladenine glycosylase 2 [unclassified Achromobacter]
MTQELKSSINPMSSTFSFKLALPRGYSPADAIHFHGRDKEKISEVVTELGLRKGVLLGDAPAVLDIEIESSKKSAVYTVAVDGKLTDGMQTQATDIVRGLLGLRLDPRSFAAFVTADPVFGPLTKRQKTLRIVQSASVFEALTWAVMGQQINVAFAVTLRRTFIQLAGRRHSSGLWCYPSPADAARIPIEELLSRQYSRSKAETVLRLSTLVASGELDIVESATNPIESICAALLAVKGIGPWTVNYALLRGFGQPDCSLHGDVAVRSAIGKLWGLEVRPDMAAAEALLQRYSPHRTMAAAHLWASLSAKTGY